MDGDFVTNLAEAFAPNLDGNKIMNGANIFSGVVEKIAIPVVKKLSEGQTVANTSTTSSTSNGSTVTVEKGKYTATGTVGNTASTVNRKVQDTVVKTSDAAKVKAQNTKDSIKAVNQNNKINSNTNFTD